MEDRKKESLGGREEARPLELKALYKSQLKAAVRGLEVLKPTADEVSGINKNSTSRDGSVKLPELDEHRSSRILFLSGEPGNGKTTVYTSLRGALSSPRTDPHRDDERPVRRLLDRASVAIGSDNEHAANDAETARLLRRADNLINDLRHKIIWLEPLDLEPMAGSGSANFLAAVMARIGNAIDDRIEKEDGSRAPSILEPKSRHHEAIMSLQRLQTDLALSWDGNLPMRAAHIDPDTFSAEVLRTERARVSVNRRLQEVLLRLSNDVFPRERFDAPLFVLPIDDFYLHPATSMELLRLLRMISSPHLFILLMGDIDVIEELFYQKSLGDLIEIAGEVAYRVDRRQRDRLGARADALRAGAMRKLLPPAQRQEVKTLEIGEARGFRPPSLSRESRSLEELLDKLLLPNPNQAPTGRPSSMKQLLLAKWSAKDGEKDYDYAYSGARLLEAPPRHALDLWHTVDDLSRAYDDVSNRDASDDTKVRRKKNADLRKIIGEELLRAFYEQDRVQGANRVLCEKAIRPGAGQYEDYRLDTTKFVAKVDGDRNPGHVDRIKVFRRSDWSLTTGGNRPVDLDFPPRFLAWFAVLHDFLMFNGGLDLLGGSLVTDAFCGKWVTTDSSEKEWPVPQWKTFWHFELLQQAWKDVINGAEFTKRSREWYPYRWIEAICKILLWDPTKDEDHRLEPLQEKGNAPEEPEWEKLVNLVKKLSEEATVEIATHWLEKLRDMLNEQLGIPDHITERLQAASAIAPARPSPKGL